jgi:DNA modification methylase
MQRTKAIGLLHKQIMKDSAMSRMALADYIITVRKPGENDEPVSGVFETYYGDDLTDDEMTAQSRRSFHDKVEGRSFADHKSIQIWQRYAEPVWMDIAQNEVLSRQLARAEKDERHISPLQLTPIRRCMDLWTNPGDVVLSPFAGIGSVGYIAIEMGRRFIGAELKASYYRQAVSNLQGAERERDAGTLFDSVA